MSLTIVKYTHGEWEYWYDRLAQVWRAFRGDWEVNQYHKDELLWVIEHIDVEHLQSDIPANVKPTLYED